VEVSVIICLFTKIVGCDLSGDSRQTNGTVSEYSLQILTVQQLSTVRI